MALATIGDECVGHRVAKSHRVRMDRTSGDDVALPERSKFCVPGLHVTSNYLVSAPLPLVSGSCGNHTFDLQPSAR